MKKRTRPEYGKTESLPLSTQALRWLLSMIDDSVEEKTDALLEYLDTPSTQEQQDTAPTLPQDKKTR